MGSVADYMFYVLEIWVISILLNQTYVSFAPPTVNLQ